MPGVFEPPEDTERDDPSLPPGTIAVELRDADDKPVAGETVTLGILINSVAKGDSRKHVQQTTDAPGDAAFSGLDTASNIAYRVSVGYQGGAFAATPFQLAAGQGDARGAPRLPGHARHLAERSSSPRPPSPPRCATTASRSRRR